MTELINILENDNLWFIDCNHKDNFTHVAEKINLPQQIIISERTIKEYIKEKIIALLQGEGISNVSYGKTLNYLSLRHFSSNRKSCRNSLAFLKLLRFFIGNLNGYTTSLDSWQLAKIYLENLISISSHDGHLQIISDDDNKTITASIKYLQKRNYNVIISYDRIYLDQTDEVRFFDSIKYKFEKLGVNALNFTLKCIYKKYNHEFRRYFLRSEPGVIHTPDADTPWGYIFNVSIANLHEVKFKNEHKIIFLDCLELLRNYFCIQRLQTFNKYGDITQNHETILNHIQKNISYDQYFSIDQTSDKHIYKIISGVFSSSVLSAYDINIRLYLSVIDFVNSHAKLYDKLQFTCDDFIRYAGNYLHYDTQQMIGILNELSFTPDEINKDYLKPDEIKKRNYYERPFIYSDGKYIYINPILNNFGFYSSLQKKFVEKGADGNAMGKAIESFVEKLFIDSGITFISGKKYNITKEVASELSIKSTERECDFVIETEGTIFLIELKRKTLTSQARSGNVLQSTIDLAQSCLHPLAQTGCHEYLLRRDGEINFKDGTKLELLGRDIERIALSMFGFFGVQDGVLIHQTLNSLINTQIVSGNEEEDIKINKYLDELNSQYKTSIFQSIYGIYPNNPFFNCRFFSAPQFMELLSNCHDNEDFKIEINRTRHVTTGSKDWFKEYQYIRKLQTNRL